MRYIINKNKEKLLFQIINIEIENINSNNKEFEFNKDFEEYIILIELKIDSDNIIYLIQLYKFNKNNKEIIIFNLLLIKLLIYKEIMN